MAIWRREHGCVAESSAVASTDPHWSFVRARDYARVRAAEELAASPAVSQTSMTMILAAELIEVSNLHSPFAY